jgi:shikimate kinase
MNIVLIGQRGSGKTQIGKLLSERLGKNLVSASDELKKRVKPDKQSFIKKNGLEKYFETLALCIEFLCKKDDCIIDTDEEVVLRKENVNSLKLNGLIIMLTADQKTIASRLKSAKPAPKIKDLDFSEGKSLAAADYVVDTSNVDPGEVCDMVVHYIGMELR